MRGKLSIGIGAAAVAITIGTTAGIASATAAGHQRAAGAVTAAASVNRHITKAQARQIAKAKVPHSRVIEVESDDHNDRPVWKVQLATPHGRVIVDVDKRTGKATIIRGSGGGHGDAVSMANLGSAGPAGDDRAADAQEHRRDARDRDDAAEDRNDRQHRGDHGDRNRHDRHDNDRDDIADM